MSNQRNKKQSEEDKKNPGPEFGILSFVLGGASAFRLLGLVYSDLIKTNPPIVCIMLASIEMVLGIIALRPHSKNETGGIYRTLSLLGFIFSTLTLIAGLVFIIKY
jgi:hypothetical protein